MRRVQVNRCWIIMTIAWPASHPLPHHHCRLTLFQLPRCILQLFDPLMAISPTTPKREESNASPDNSDKENDAPRDPLSLSQYFNQSYHADSLQKSATPNGKLIDFGSASIGGGDELALSGSSAVTTEPQLETGDGLLSTPYRCEWWILSRGCFHDRCDILRSQIRYCCFRTGYYSLSPRL
ncbi:hypothetical protein BDM02DRAFT_2976709 [Thelephora ganbajun]|uniref:Uncharacterized protein n=1 Tax=Thelephora ganbajun TaxID=370292 RepID=A0ACB6ZB15_THEGA|nr:hypothetical protein BDM02DRAFT_2976709 [Thelephora ganbajun]